MKLCAFRIRNFRSITDTGWQTLSPDNITCLIGQNESGKTSILEGLRSFYTGSISEDVLRSDLTLPLISCRFMVNKGWLIEVTENPGSELKELLSGLSSVELSRNWLPDFSSTIKVSGIISEYLDSLENAWRLYLDEVKTKLESEIEGINRNKSRLNDILSEKAGIIRSADPLSGKGLVGRLFRKPGGVTSERLPADHRNRFDALTREEETIRKNILDRQVLAEAGTKYNTLIRELGQADEKLSALESKLEEYHQKMTLLLMPMDRYEDPEWTKVLEDFRYGRVARDKLAADLEAHIAVSGYLMEGRSREESQMLTDEAINRYRSQYTSEILGKKYFEFCPEIEMFEDFGSLLPNRIDLEDIITGNEQVEGYKAARNFLTLAKLDYSFFQQQSSRILKQKIENLNNSLTVNFQDFWQQSIGRNNKIRIQFELDHYSLNFINKAGKPYLEFWVKDSGERLYPKQRSRGVRWFLSFYMELKASALKSTRPVVLLVDEPGISLHARAQEDVLKVFEDIKDRIQIIYTTHSPHLVDINKMHRVLAVQRDDIDNLRSTTRVLDPLKLASASPDTLTPLQSIMGNPLSAEGFSATRLNLIVNDTGTFYLISCIMHLTGFKGKISIIPSTDISTIPLMCNIMMGWGLRFAVLLFGNEKERGIGEYLKENMFRIEGRKSGHMILTEPGFLNAEDLLSTLDFKNHVIKTREGITIPNSVYMEEKELPRNFLLSRLLSEVKQGIITSGSLDEETHENFRYLIDLLKEPK